ncbi:MULTISPECIES: DNA-3-methyladenine glycosylase I [Burkholderia cepacia complex]|uniref:DNA-3-methyladenine glycosylase I n=1 Tax=Burkholderia cepacia complex TaxID=87882 RepID=UPI0020113B3A|nr:MULTISPECIES: DNA-3-methyladenine glycosylase I [Burkholderia cepacia complex]MDN7578118.1 DNA-3-methyladenine glycosylase I [Burkholderia orbicola]MDN7579469.1 DNA-3-methyladenine glycosylase I [Burkholderia orbicola]
MQRTIDKRPVTRCEWADGDPPMQAYHDHEWGVPARDELGLVVGNRVMADDSPHVSGQKRWCGTLRLRSPELDREKHQKLADFVPVIVE